MNVHHINHIGNLAEPYMRKFYLRLYSEQYYNILGEAAPWA